MYRVLSFALVAANPVNNGTTVVGVASTPIVAFFGTFDPTLPVFFTCTEKAFGLRTMYILPAHCSPLATEAVVKVGTIRLTIEVDV